MITLSFSNIVTKAKRFDIIINIGTGALENTYYPYLSTFGIFKLGSVDDDEMKLFPGRFDISFRVQTCQVYNGSTLSLEPNKAAADTIFYDILNRIKAATSVGIVIYDAGTTNVFYSATLASDSLDLVNGEIYTREISLIFMDDYSVLNLPPVIYRHTSGPLTGVSQYWPDAENMNTIKSMSQIIAGLLPNVTINISTDFKFKYYDNSSLNYYDCYLGDVGSLNYIIFDSRFNDTRGHILKTILDSFASYAVIDMNRALKIIPRFYNGATVTNISRSNIIGPKLSFRMVRTYSGLIAEIGYLNPTGGTLEFQPDGYPEDRVKNRVTIDGFTQEVFIPFGVGGVVGTQYDINSFGHSKTLFKTDGSHLAANRVCYKKGDGTYSEERSLGQWAGQLCWEAIANSGGDYIAEMPGINYSFTDYFRIENGSMVYRPVYMEIDCNKDTTRITLRECTNSDVAINSSSAMKFTAPLKAVNLSAKVNGVTYPEGNVDLIKVFVDNIILSFQNVWASNLLSAEQFDGSVIDIPTNQLGIWNDSFQYLIYIYISTDGNPPSVDYPNTLETNGKWYIYDSFEGTDIDHIDTTGSEYFFVNHNNDPITDNTGGIASLVPSGEVITMIDYTVSQVKTYNKYWFAVYMATADTKLFPGIPVYGK